MEEDSPLSMYFCSCVGAAFLCWDFFEREETKCIMKMSQTIPSDCVWLVFLEPATTALDMGFWWNQQLTATLFPDLFIHLTRFPNHFYPNPTPVPALRSLITHCCGAWFKTFKQHLVILSVLVGCDYMLDFDQHVFSQRLCSVLVLGEAFRGNYFQLPIINYSSDEFNTLRKKMSNFY